MRRVLNQAANVAVKAKGPRKSAPNFFFSVISVFSVVNTLSFP